MHGDPLEIFSGRPLQQPEVGTPVYGEIRHCLPCFRSIVMKACRPEILIVTADLRTIVSQRHPQSITPNQLRISQMLQDVTDGPLAGALRTGDLIRR
jgi:hypothetical protein